MMNRETTGGPERRRPELAREAARTLEAVAGAVARSLDRHAADYGLSDAKLEVLEVLRCCDDRRACLYAVGERLGVTRPNVTKLVDGLERAGLVERLPHPHDKRMVHAHLTPAGADVADRALPGRQRRIERVWDALSDEQLEGLVALLGAVAEGAAGPGGDAESRPAATLAS